MPHAFRAGHHVQVIAVVAIRHGDGVVATRHHHHVVVFHGHGFVNAAVIRVDALVGKALLRMEAVVIGFFQRTFGWNIVAVVLVRRIAGRMAGRRDDFHHQQAVRLGRLRQDVAHIARVGALAAHGARHGGRFDQARRTVGRGRGAAQGHLGGAHGRDTHRGFQRHIHGVGRDVLEDAGALADAFPYVIARLHRDRARQHDEAQLAVARLQADVFAGLQPVRGKAHVRPAGRFRRDFHNLAAGLACFDQQRAHAASRPRRGIAWTRRAR
ncbi:hypothetical protein JAB5_25880 [Janthinobacterium sp. HH103]|nr:hypothetical protein JAB5_25880 [Janthinobacterium sp. HH103]